MSIRQSDAREVKERLLRTRAFLVAQKSQKALVTTGKHPLPQIKPTVLNPGYQNPVEMVTGEKILAVVKPTVSSPRQDSQDGGINSAPSSRKTLGKDDEKFGEMSRILKESVPNQKEVSEASGKFALRNHKYYTDIVLCRRVQKTTTLTALDDE